MLKVWHSVTAPWIAVALGTISSAAGAADVVETMREVSSSGQFQIDAFASAIEAAGIADELEGAGPYTIFAPTNEAFQTLGIEALKPGGPAKTPEEQLQSANKDQLSQIVKQHIVEGRTSFDQLLEQAQLEPLHGVKLDVSQAKGGVLVNDIEILEPNVIADNGVIHVIGGLLVPEKADQTGSEQQQ